MLRQEPNPDLERVRFEMRAAGVRDAKANPHRTGVHTRGYLPHVKLEGASYFVTFRLEDSLPREVLMRFQAERAARLRSLHGKSPAHKPPGPGGLDPKQEVDQEFYREVERYLDKGVGACHLACPEIADAVATSLRFFEGQRYLLRSWVIMPNHVHVVVWPKPNFLLNAIVKTWKGYTAREANKILGRTGERFWQPESFDHWIRNDHQMAKVCQYVINNPVKARLCASPEQWRWSSAGPGPGTNLPGDPQ